VPKLRIALAQINTTVGDLSANTDRILRCMELARKQGADLITFPELAICGYPPEDLLFKTEFIEQNLKCLDHIIGQCRTLTAVVGFVDRKVDIYNAAAIIEKQKLIGVYHKIFLPNYGVFDENRYFRAGEECPLFIIQGIATGINICEDIWYEDGPATAQASAGAELILNISASPYHRGKREYRENMLKARATDNTVIVAFNNLIGGQDELVFDGNSIIIDERGRILAGAKAFKEDLLIADINTDAIFNARLHDSRWRKAAGKQHWPINKIEVSEQRADDNKTPLKVHKIKKLNNEAEVYSALVLGTRDYITKNSFQKVVIGLSGGIDSSLVATIAVDALSSKNVIGVAMPSRFSSPQSLDDARLLVENLHIELRIIPIDTIFRSYLKILRVSFAGTNEDITEENLQARIRGNLLMALSNKFGWIVLTTGNKSEMATGYTTLYGDMAGGFAVIKDIPKTLVYRLAIYRNSLHHEKLIPSSILRRAPSAELKPGQKDIDTLPPYETLDPILNAYVEEDQSLREIKALGFDLATAKRVVTLVDRSEYKRRQSPPGIKITPRAFGRDRRLPITSRYREF
jgi:NAD+ synthase (glutamine-hydrolysing)